MPDQINQIDADQNQEIALLKQRVQQLEDSADAEMIKELRERVRKLERWVWGAAAVILPLGTLQIFWAERIAILDIIPQTELAM